MKEILTAAAMKRRDLYTIEELGVPSAVLMERAALACAEEVQRLAPAGRVLAVCGSGNNGGDGIACARILTLRGCPCDILFAGNPAHMTEETARQYEIARRLNLSFIGDGAKALSRYDVLVDALFGIGLTRDITGDYAELIAHMNASGHPVISVDIPSGIDADTGAVRGTAVRAAVTVTMQREKPGHLLYPGRSFCGRLVTAEIGVASDGRTSPLAAFEQGDLREFLPVRPEEGNKGTFGKVLIAAGSHNMAGAALLAASAALRSGCGMVRVLTHESNRLILQTALPEALLTTWTKWEELASSLEQAAGWADVIACGPGLGQSEETAHIVRWLLAGTEKPLVLDADALNVLSANQELSELLRTHTGPVTVTPHIGEMARLTGKSARELKASPLAEAGNFARHFGVTCVMKDACTVTALPDGRLYMNTTGNSGMAAAGSGDVLTGITAGLLAQGAGSGTAGALASYIHGRAGDYAAGKRGRRAMTAGDLIDGLAAFLLDYEAETGT